MQKLNITFPIHTEPIWMLMRVNFCKQLISGSHLYCGSDSVLWLDGSYSWTWYLFYGKFQICSVWWLVMGCFKTGTGWLWYQKTCYQLCCWRRQGWNRLPWGRDYEVRGLCSISRCCCVQQNIIRTVGRKQNTQLHDLKYLNYICIDVNNSGTKVIFSWKAQVKIISYLLGSDRLCCRCYLLKVSDIVSLAIAF